MKPGVFLMVCLNIAILAAFYTGFGGLLSFGLKNVFYKLDENWQTFNLSFKIGEVLLEIVVIGIIAYWSMFFIEKAPPIFPVSKKFDKSVDTYISGIFFAYAIFLFFGDLSHKIQYIYTELSDSVTRKMDGKQTKDKIHQNGV
jgi:small-conductance mechanosensitive channel